MATDFDPVPPPLDLPAVPAVLSPSIPLNPPMVGSVNPFQHVDGNNRDLILEAIRTWIRVSLLPWTTSWQDQLTEWEGDVATQLDAWMVEADAYITAHAISGLSFRSTVTDIAPEGTTNVVLANVDETYRPVVVGDLVLDNSPDSNYGIVTVVIDDTHATVEYVGSLRGLAGFSWRLTATPIAPEGTTNVVLTADDVRPFLLGDIVLDTAGDGNFGVVTALIDSTHVTVTYAGSLLGPQGDPGTNGVNGLSWRYTATPIAGAGTTDVTFVAPSPALQVGDLVTDTTGSGNVATITALIDATHATVTYLENLKGAPGADGVMTSVVAGSGISVDSTDPANPIVSLLGDGVYHYTNFAELDAAYTLPDGSVAVVDSVDRQYVSLWVLSSGAGGTATWACMNMPYLDNDPGSWASLNGVITGYPHLSLAGAGLTESVTGSRPQWVEGLGVAVQDFSSHIGPVGSGGNTNYGPGGSHTILPDNTVQLDIVSQFEIYPDFTPGFDIDLTDAWELRLVGEMSANGPVFFRWLGPDFPDTSAAHYMEFGTTDQMTSGAFTVDTAFEAGFGVNGEWSLVTDTTNGPTFIDLSLVVRHVPETSGGLSDHGFPAIAESDSHYFTDPSVSGGIVSEFHRKGTHFYYGTSNYRSFIVIFGDGGGGAPYFSGRMTLNKVKA